MIELIVLVIAIIASVWIFKLTKAAQIKRGTSKGVTIMASLSASFLVFVVIVIAGATMFSEKDNTGSTKNLKVISVSDYDFTMKDKQSVSISIGITKDKYYNFTIHRDQIKNNVTLNKNKDNYISSIDATATFGKDNYYFLIRDGFNSYINFSILKIDTKNKEATISISALLYNPNDGDSVELKEQKFNIGGVMFDNLVK